MATGTRGCWHRRYRIRLRLEVIRYQGPKRLEATYPNLRDRCLKLTRNVLALRSARARRLGA